MLECQHSSFSNKIAEDVEDDDELYMTPLGEHMFSDRFEVINNTKTNNCPGYELEHNHTSTQIEEIFVGPNESTIIDSNSHCRINHCVHVLHTPILGLQTLNVEQKQTVDNTTDRTDWDKALASLQITVDDSRNDIGNKTQDKCKIRD